MTAPLCQGDLWWYLTGQLQKEKNPEGLKLRDRLVVLLSIDDLRREDVRVSKGLSWERTAIDLVRTFEDSPTLSSLRQVKHVIVTFHGDGALWVNREGGKCDYRLIFDPHNMEQEWAGAAGIKDGAYGFMSCFTAAIAANMAFLPDPADKDHVEHEMPEGIKQGLHVMRLLRLLGHGPATKKNANPGFPFEDLAWVLAQDKGHAGAVPGCQAKPANKEAKDKALPPPSSAAHDCRKRWPYGVVTIPHEALDMEMAAPRWHILDGHRHTLDKDGCQPLYGIAKRVAIFGPQALIEAPVASFGKLTTPDRDEIEALNNLKLLMKGYTEQKADHKPLSLGIFGPPGAGKSFGIREIAEELMGKAVTGKDLPFLEFNLSQFNGVTDLIGAFHQVRDKVLEGHTPLVFWDEFDSGEYKWLQYLLAPMQDGKFQEGQVTHPIGKCIFAFAGATSYDKENFGPTEPTVKATKEQREAWNRFKLGKGPDFLSRLHGFINVLGPNRRQIYDSKSKEWLDDSCDVCFPIRRALLLRASLRIPKDQRLLIDRGLLSALLEVDRYTHGARSFTKIAEYLRPQLAGPICRSSLPPDEVLRMNVDLARFSELLTGVEGFQKNAEKLAPVIHETYRRLARKEKWDFRWDMDYAKLPPAIKADNTEAAFRIPWILELAGLFLVAKGKRREACDSDVPRLLEGMIEVLAEEEHDLWAAYKLEQGWKPGPRDDDKRIHPCLMPFRELAEKDKEKDRNSVRNFPAITEQAGFKIVRRKPTQAKKTPAVV
jgi:hypothetical protein